jgi:drug/metabolite transporter, DME family
VDRRLGFLCITVAGALFGSIGVATKGVYAVSATNAFSITLLRALIALPVLGATAFITLGPAAVRIARRDLGVMVIAGAMIVLYQVAYVVALTLASVTIVALLTPCTMPLCAGLLSRLILGERLRPGIVVALVLATAGVVLLIGFEPIADTGPRSWIGIALALVSAVGYACYQICGRIVSPRYHPSQTLSVFLLVAALLLLPITLANGFVLAYPPSGWLLLLYLGLGISVLGHGLLVQGLKTTPVTTAAILSLLEPLMGAALGWALFGERLGIPGLIGGALLLSAMAIVSRGPRPSPRGVRRLEPA